MSIQIAIAPEHENNQASAQVLSKALKLPLVSLTNRDEYDYLLVQSDQYLSIEDTHTKKRAPFYIDFLSKTFQYRLKHASKSSELLRRAINISPSENPILIDATAGLGRDSFILAALGYNVTMLEQSPIVHALLADALERARQAHPDIVARLTLQLCDAKAWLSQQTSKPDIIYIDPMFPERRKLSAVKKDMQLLQNLLVEDDLDPDALFKVAIACAAKRVVVKRPRIAVHLCNKTPSHTLT